MQSVHTLHDAFVRLEFAVGNALTLPSPRHSDRVVVPHTLVYAMATFVEHPHHIDRADTDVSVHALQSDHGDVDCSGDGSAEARNPKGVNTDELEQPGLTFLVERFPPAFERD